MRDSPILGIDLGTTSTRMALVGGEGRPVVLPNARGARHTPSALYFPDGGAWLAGEAALDRLAVDPGSGVAAIKRYLGQEKAFTFHGTSYTPPELAALLLRTLKEDAERATGLEIRETTLSVPSCYQAPKRGAMAEAGAIAGLEILSVINEPVATVLACRSHRLNTDRKRMVLDAGGGSFDATVLQSQGSKWTTLASDERPMLGGHAWDERLCCHISERLLEEYGIALEEAPDVRQALRERCPRIKIALSSVPSAAFEMEHRGQRLVIDVDRPLFERLTHDLVEQCEASIERALVMARVSPREIDEVLLVGAASRMPMLRTRLPRCLPYASLGEIEPETSVAIGLAIAGVLRHRPAHRLAV